MKITSSVVASLLLSVAAARPRVKEEGDPLEQTSRVTAFVIDKDGKPSVECWEISNIVDSMRVKRADGSAATAQSVSLATSRELEGIDILTWPSVSPIWPPPSDEVKTQYFDLHNTFNLFSVQGGLINFNFYAARFGAKGGDDDVETHIFSLENGDDWFYFEDSSSDSNLARKAGSDPYPIDISTVSATETELLRLRYSNQPKHKVIHKGACKFTGIETPSESSSYESPAASGHSPLTVQVRIEDSL